MRASISRYTGVAGSATIAVSSYLAGARQTGQPGPLSLDRLAADPGYALGCGLWLAGAAALLGAWWLARGVGGTRWTLITALLWTLPLAVSAPIGSRDVYAYANQGQLLAGGGDPYQVGPAALPTPWLSQMAEYWAHEPTPYGPLFVLLCAAIATVAASELTVAVALLRATAVAGVVACAYLVPRLARQCGVAPALAVWLALACPLTLIHLVAGAHNEALLLAGVLAAMLAAARGRLWWCGAALGLAVAIKATALIAAPFAVLLLARRGDWRSIMDKTWRCCGIALTVLAAVTLVSGLGVGWIGALAVSGKSVSWLSIPTGVGIASAKALLKLGAASYAPYAVPLWRAVGLAAAVVAVIALWWRARGAKPAAVLAACGWAFTAVTLLGPVLLTWYVIPPLLLLACAGVHRRAVLGLAVTATVFTLLVFPDGHNIAAERLVKPGLLLDLALAVALAGLAWRWWRTPGATTPEDRPLTAA